MHQYVPFSGKSEPPTSNRRTDKATSEKKAQSSITDHRCPRAWGSMGAPFSA